MKFSKYIRKIEFDSENLLLRNLFNGAIYLIPRKDFIEIEQSLQDGRDIIECHKDALLQELFIVEEEPIHKYYRDADMFLITIETTSKCNLQCSYCYENDKGTRNDISESVINDILCYIESVFLQDQKHRGLCVGFIGGEPLLRIEDIYSIYSKVMKLGNLYGRKLSFHIDTNGTIPFDGLFATLDNLHVSVSLTPRDDHNKNRCGNGFDSFNSIIANLKNLTKKVGNSLSIRYNTNEKNINQFREFVSYIRSNIPICDTIEPMYTDEYDHAQFKNNLELDTFRDWNSTTAIDILIENGYRIPYSIGGVLAPCIAYQTYSCKVYTDGKITLCDSMLHNDSRCDISQICRNPDLLDIYFSEYKNYNPLDDCECCECVNLARCMGKLFCRTEKCNYNKRFNDDLLAATFTKYFLSGKGTSFYGML